MVQVGVDFLASQALLLASAVGDLPGLAVVDLLASAAPWFQPSSPEQLVIVTGTVTKLQ